MLDLRRVMGNFSFPNRKLICAIWRHGLSTFSGDSYVHKLCWTHSGCFYFVMRGILCLTFTNLNGMFNDTSRYLDDIFNIDIPEFEKHIPDIYPTELSSDKETSFLIKRYIVIGSNVHTSVYDKRDDFGFAIVNFPWMFLDSHRKVFTFLSWVDLLGVVLAFLISILKIFKLSGYFQTTDKGLQISQTSKNIWKVLHVIPWAFI